MALAISCEGAQSCEAMKKTKKTIKVSGDATLAIHVGQDKFHKGASVGVEIARTANFTFASTEEMKRWAEEKAELTFTRATEIPR